MPGRRILGNLLWEDELARRRTSPPRAVLDTVSGLATLLRAFAREGDRLWTPAPVDPERVLAAPGLPRPILESGPLRDLPPVDEVLAWGDSSAVATTVHHRAFCLQMARELGCALPGARMVESLPDLERVLTSFEAPRSWVVKAPLSASGRNRYIERMEPEISGPEISDPRSRRTIARLFDRHGPLLFEPWMNRTADFGVAAVLTETELHIVGIHGQHVDGKGQFAGIDLKPSLSGAERDLLLETVESVASALRRAGYVGPFGIDAWRYRKPGGEEIFHPLGEINARLTFGRVAWALAERLPGAVRLLFGRSLPVPEPGKAGGIVPLLAPGSEKGTAAWIELETPRMDHAPDVRRLDHHHLAVAERIHAIQMAAYAQEAALLEAVSFPPLQRQVVDVQRAEGDFLGAFLDGQLAGSLSVEPGSVEHELTISSLTVAPEFQRRGLGRALVAAVLREFTFRRLTVSTGARNLPALALYAEFGFVEFSRRLVGEEQLEVVELRLNGSY